MFLSQFQLPPIFTAPIIFVIHSQQVKLFPNVEMLLDAILVSSNVHILRLVLVLNAIMVPDLEVRNTEKLKHGSTKHPGGSSPIIQI
jgi:hypothetical protein